MAAIYDARDWTTITEGLQGCVTCDEGMQTVERMIREGDYPDGLVLADDDGEWLVTPLLAPDGLAYPLESGLVRYRPIPNGEAV